MLVNQNIVLRSLDTDAVVPFYQPLRELRTGQLMGFELLTRWKHPEQGPILPPDFIAVAERSGLLTRLTEHILAKAFESVDDRFETPNLAINISPLQLRDPGISACIGEVARKHNFPLDHLTIEITETSLVDNLELAQEITHTLKRMGCKVLLDDFGTGYSSLAHLQSLHFDGLKIDRSFVRGITEVREDRKIVAAIIGLGQNLGITTIAEGIETEAQASMLLYLGCDLGQGYLYGRPEPVDCVPRHILAAPPVVSPSTSLYGQEPTLHSLESFPVERIAQLQAIYDGAPVGLCYLNRELRYVSANRQLAEINGISVLAMIGRSVASVSPDWFPIYQPYLQRALNGESMRNIELNRPPRDGGDHEQCVLVSYEPARDEADEVIGISIAVMDITERKQKERLLAESEERFRTIIDLNPQTPWILDTEGNIIEVGSQWQKNTGYTRSETLQRGYMETVVDEDRDEVWTIIQNCLKTGDPMDFECRARRPDGTPFWIRVRGRAVLDAQGNVLRFYGSTDDIDEAKRYRAIEKDRAEKQKS